MIGSIQIQPNALLMLSSKIRNANATEMMIQAPILQGKKLDFIF